MNTGFILIMAVLVLGGAIATAGDRIGMKVGKARLSLFNLRPRQTATVITILTGSVVSASTLAILFAVSDQLRRGVFEYDQIQDNLAETQEELDQARKEQTRIEAELSEVEAGLNQAESERITAQQRLNKINESLRGAIARQARTAEQLEQTQSQLRQVGANFEQAQAQLRRVSQQATTLRSEIRQLQSERQALLRQQAEVRTQIAERDREIAQRDQAIAEREVLLTELERQRTFLVQEVQNLEQEFQGLRQGNVALLRNQILAFGVVRVVSPEAAPAAVDQLLREANRIAVQRLRPGGTNVDEQVVQITNAEVEELINRINDGQDYVVQILSAGNYVVGEPCVLAGESCIQVVATAVPNRVVFSAGDIIASTVIDPSTVTERQIIERFNYLIAASQFRARQTGIIAGAIQLSDGQTETINRFFERLRQYSEPIEIRTVAADVTYIAGPLRIELIAIQNGQVLFRTGEVQVLPRLGDTELFPRTRESDNLLPD